MKNFRQGLNFNSTIGLKEINEPLLKKASDIIDEHIKFLNEYAIEKNLTLFSWWYGEFFEKFIQRVYGLGAIIQINVEMTAEQINEDEEAMLGFTKDEDIWYEHIDFNEWSVNKIQREAEKVNKKLRSTISEVMPFVTRYLEYATLRIGKELGFKKVVFIKKGSRFKTITQKDIDALKTNKIEKMYNVNKARIAN